MHTRVCMSGLGEMGGSDDHSRLGQRDIHKGVEWFRFN